MKVAIVGAGKLGLSVTEALWVADMKSYSSIRIRNCKLSNQLDLLTVEGNARM